MIEYVFFGPIQSERCLPKQDGDKKWLTASRVSLGSSGLPGFGTIDVGIEWLQMLTDCPHLYVSTVVIAYD